MKKAQFLGLVARANAERAMLDAGRGAASSITAREVREIHSVITKGLGDLDDSFSPARGALRSGGAGLDRVTRLLNDLHGNRRVGPSTRDGVAEACGKILSSFAREGVFSSFNLEVGLVLAQRHARSNDFSIRFSEIEPEDLRAAVTGARSGRLGGLTSLIKGAITHAAVHRAEQAGYSVGPGEKATLQVPANLSERLASIALRVESGPAEVSSPGPVR